MTAILSFLSYNYLNFIYLSCLTLNSTSSIFPTSTYLVSPLLLMVPLVSFLFCFVFSNSNCFPNQIVYLLGSQKMPNPVFEMVLTQAPSPNAWFIISTYVSYNVSFSNKWAKWIIRLDKQIISDSVFFIYHPT